VTNRVRVEHTSVYEYVNIVHSSFNEARITPLTTPSQLVLESRVEVEPPTPLQAYVDYWGTVVHAFDLQQPHDTLKVVGRSIVETDPPLPAPRDTDWEELRDGSLQDRFSEFLAPTVQVPADPRLTDTAELILDHHRPTDAVLAAIEWVRSELTYVPGTTGVHTSAMEAWEGGEGVCQDFAHLTLALLRAMGLPARYCSGYVHPDGDARLGAKVEGESHAWLEVWTGDWQGFDPTAGKRIGDHHVLVARGRDYTDVTPIKGIFHGGPTARLQVTVSLTRLA
jgi:transglutaminase-like putative cysteine protease